MSGPPPTTLILDGPLDLPRTLGTGHGPRDPTTFRDRDGGLWRAHRMPAGPATLHVRSVTTTPSAEGGPQTTVVVRAWGPGALEVIERAGELLGLHDDPTALVARHRLVRDLARRVAGIRLGRGRPLFDELVPTILGQRVTAEEAHDAYRRLVFDRSEPAPGPARLWLPPSPRALTSLPLYAYQRHGIEGSRARAVVAVAELARHVRCAETLPPEKACALLQQLPGVGPWTANNALGAARGWADAVPVGDYHLPNLVAWALAGEARGTDARMLQLLAPYAGQRWRVLKLLGAGVRHAPRFGPRRGAWRTRIVS